MTKKWLSFFCLSVLFMCLCFQGYCLESGSFEWGKAKPQLNSYEQLKDRWISSLLQECVRSKLEKEFIDHGVKYSINLEEGLLPCRFSATVLDGSSIQLETLERMELGQSIDFSEEFSIVQAIWKEWIQAQKNTTFSTEWISESMFSYAEFLEYSEEILQSLRLDDLTLAFGSKEAEPIKSLERINAVAFREDLASHHSFLPSKKGWEPAETGRGGEPKSEEAKLFFNLPITDEDKVIIRKIITTMADKNVLQLLLDKSSMERKGDKIRPVHPMRFIGFVLSDPNLRRCLKSVSKTTFKWSGFLDGYEKRMKEESKAGNLKCYCAGLADLLEVDRNVIQHYINQGNYEGLIKHFL